MLQAEQDCRGNKSDNSGILVNDISSLNIKTDNSWLAMLVFLSHNRL
jgi:hypothetical protein